MLAPVAWLPRCKTDAVAFLAAPDRVRLKRLSIFENNRWISTMMPIMLQIQILGLNWPSHFIHYPSLTPQCSCLALPGPRPHYPFLTSHPHLPSLIRTTMDDTSTSTAPSRSFSQGMASSAAATDSPVSAAMLMDPKAMKRYLMTNGSSISSHLDMSPSAIRLNSEPPPSALFLNDSIAPYLPSAKISKDDAYKVFESKGKKVLNTQQVGQTSSNQFEARRLLDPIGSQDPLLTSNDSNISRPPSPVRTSQYHLNGGPLEANGNRFHKRDYEDFEGQGMTSLIERVHNVSQRGDRPQKKLKFDTFQEEEKDSKAIHGGGGKGGEIAAYLKQKKKEGIAESGPVSNVVDLTGGTYNLFNFQVLKALK